MKTLLKKKLALYPIASFLGILSSLSLPPYNYFFLNFLVFPFLLFILLNTNIRIKLFLIGWNFGFGYFLSNLYWITNSLTFDDKFKIIIPFALILVPSFLALFYGLITFLTSFFELKNKISSIFIFSILFGSVELLRGYILGGFPWNLTVFSLTNHLYSIQILSFIGTYSLNLLSITVFLIPSIIFFQLKNAFKTIIILSGLILILINIGYGKYTLDQFRKKNYDDLDFVIRIVSPNIPIERFLKNQDTKKNIYSLINLSNPEKSKKTVFIFPEGVVNDIYLNDLKLFKEIFEENYEYNHKIIFGINNYIDGKIYNSLITIDNKADQLFVYNKNKLVPFGEFLPLENFFKKLGLKKITQGYQSFSPDSKREIFRLNQLTFLPLICYEIIYSGKLNYNKQNYDFILNISEDGWFGKSAGLEQHLSHSIFRSIEEGKNVIRSTNNGISAFINPKGQIIKKITKKGYIENRSFKHVDKTYFASYGNKIFFYFLLFYITLIFFLKKKENK